MERVQRFERHPLEELFERNFERAYDLAYALTGDAVQAERMVERAFLRALDTFATYRGGGRGLDTMVLRLVAKDAARTPSHTPGMRSALARLAPADYQTVALRLLGGLDADVIASGSGRRVESVWASLASGLRRLAGSTGAAGGAEVDDAVQHLLRGQQPAEAAAGLDRPTDLAALLTAAASVRGLPYEPAEPAVRSRIRTTYLAAAEERRARLVQRNQRQPEVPGVDLDKRRREGRGAVAALGIALLLALGVGIVLALLSSFADPDSPFYPLKKGGEAALIALSREPVSRADLEVKLAETRGREAETTAADGKKADLAVAATRDHYDLLRAAAADLIAARVRDARWTRARDRLETQASLSIAPLQRELESVGAKPQAQQVADENDRFQADRKVFDPKLGKAAANPNASPGASPNPNPAPAPTK